MAVLLVDDSATHRSLIKVFLSQLMLEFVEAADGATALQILERDRSIDLVIADVKMPGLDGLEFVRRVRASGATSGGRVPIILLTADKAGGLEREARAAGADAFLHKPVSSAGLQQVVEDLRKRRTTVRPSER